MFKIIKITVLYAFFLVVDRVVSDEPLSPYLFSLDYLYPQRHFYRVELTVKGVCTSLDELLSEAHLFPIDFDKVYYFLSEIERLAKAICSLYEHEKKSGMYLADDIHYLLQLMEHIEIKMVQVIETLVPHQTTVKRILAYFDNSKYLLNELFEAKKEIIAS